MLRALQESCTVLSETITLFQRYAREPARLLEQRALAARNVADLE